LWFITIVKPVLKNVKTSHVLNIYYFILHLWFFFSLVEEDLRNSTFNIFEYSNKLAFIHFSIKNSAKVNNSGKVLLFQFLIFLGEWKSFCI
jgi:hypothetical protein